MTLTWLPGTLIFGGRTDSSGSGCVAAVADDPPDTFLEDTIPANQHDTTARCHPSSRGIRARRNRWRGTAVPRMAASGGGRIIRRRHKQAKQQAAMDQHQASRDEEMVAEAMMAEIEARRADPQANAGRTIMDVGHAAADQVLSTSRNSPA